MIGTFIARELMTEQASRRNLSLHLDADGTAEFVTEFVGRGVIVTHGTWQEVNSQAQITMTDLDGESINLRMIFELREEEMVYVGPDPHAFGEAGLTLRPANSGGMRPTIQDNERIPAQL